LNSSRTTRKRTHGGKRGFSCLVLKTDKPDPKQFG
jgi:hypothetical protein